MPDSPDTDVRRTQRLGTAPATLFSTEREETEGDGSPRGVPAAAWELCLPATLALSYLVVALAVGPSVFDVDRPGLGGVVALLALGALLLAGAWSTIRLFDDAAQRRARDGRTHPNAWHYAAIGVATILALRILQLQLGAVTPAEPVPYLFGNAVVALPLSSIVAGPVYLLLRRRARSTSA